MPAISITLDRDKAVTLRYVRAVVQRTLTVQAQADTTSVAVGVTVDSQSVSTPGSLVLNEGTYTVTVPGSITVAGVTYNYSSYGVA